MLKMFANFALGTNKKLMEDFWKSNSLTQIQCELALHNNGGKLRVVAIIIVEWGSRPSQAGGFNSNQSRRAPSNAIYISNCCTEIVCIGYSKNQSASKQANIGHIRLLNY